MSPSLSELRKPFESAGQGHVFRQIEALDPAAQARFAEQLSSVDLKLLKRLIDEMRHDRPVTALELERVEPAPFLALPVGPGGRRREKRAAQAGVEALSAGKVAAMVVAGGQGSRLGFDGPKGCFPIGPVSGCSLFEWHFQKVVASRRRFSASIPMLVLTSPANHQQTLDYLRANRWFGMPEHDVLVFPQGMLPAVDFDGRLLLEAPGSLFRSPDGHGGALLALAREGILDEMTRRGIENIFYFQVDNPLVKVLDATFLGHHRLAESEMSSKMVLKRDPKEKVGVFARAGRRIGIVEYSDLPEDLAQAVDHDGSVRFGAGNIAIHVIDVAFARRVNEGGLRLPYHRAKKAIPCLDGDGVPTKPTAPNGVKFETFVFDALPLAKRALVVETSRAEEFSPVKNAEGDDSAATARRDLLNLFRSWLSEAGFAAGDGAVLEIAPSFALDRDEFTQKVAGDRVLCDGTLWVK